MLEDLTAEQREEAIVIKNKIAELFYEYRASPVELIQFVGDFVAGPVSSAMYGAKEIMIQELDDWLKARRSPDQW